MKHTFKKYSIFFILFTIAAFAGCKKEMKKAPAEQTEGSYFSIKQFGLDQWNIFAGEPFTIVKTMTINGKVDSSYTNSDTLDWSQIFKVFYATDISDREYLNKYTFTQFDQEEDLTHNFFYQANEDDLFTQKLLISIDQFTNTVRGIYIETHEGSVFNDVTQKLYYKPMKIVQIQTIEKPLFGDKKHTVEQYDFLR